MRRSWLLAATVVLAAALVASPSVVLAATTSTARERTADRPAPTPPHRPGVDFGELSHQFDYVRRPIQVTENGVERRGSVLVHDISYRAPGQDPVLAYLVEPTGGGRHPATMWLHWLGEEHADRTDFLDEAVHLASSAGLVSLLPQQVFPFQYGPVGDTRDRDAIIKQVIQLRRGLDLLDQRRNVDPQRVALVGHDYGGMSGSIVAAVDRARLRSTVLVAIDSTWGNWFVSFFLDLPQEQLVPYLALFDSLEPTAYLDHLPRGGLLFQFATNDFFIPGGVADQITGSTATPHIVRTYDTDHAMELPAVEQDRDAFLIKTLDAQGR
jgi:pimeloyl-ACP methyl ester carboxylesterase